MLRTNKKVLFRYTSLLLTVSFTGTLFRGYGNLKNNRNREERETEHRCDNAISYFNIFFLTFWIF